MRALAELRQELLVSAEQVPWFFMLFALIFHNHFIFRCRPVQREVVVRRMFKGLLTGDAMLMIMTIMMTIIVAVMMTMIMKGCDNDQIAFGWYLHFHTCVSAFDESLLQLCRSKGTYFCFSTPIFIWMPTFASGDRWVANGLKNQNFCVFPNTTFQLSNWNSQFHPILVQTSWPSLFCPFLWVRFFSPS